MRAWLLAVVVAGTGGALAIADALLARPLATGGPAGSGAVRSAHVPGEEADEVRSCAATEARRWGDDAVFGPDGVALPRNGFVHLRVCRPGVLTLRMRGASSDDRPPRVIVSLGTRPSWDGRVGAARTLSIDVARSGWITVALVDDPPAGEGDRRLWIDELAFEPHSS